MHNIQRYRGLRGWWLVLAVLIAMSPLAAVAQQQADKNVASIWTMWPKAGHEAEFEQALAAHAAWRKQAGEGFQWRVYQAIVGDDLNHYVVYTGNHAWAEFDGNDKWEQDKKASETFNKNVGPYLDRITHHFTEDDNDLSYWPSDASYPMVEVSDLRFMPGQYANFRKYVGAARSSAMAQKWSGNWSIASITGGQNDIVLVLPLRNYADMAGPKPSIMEMMAKQMGGKDKAGATMTGIQSALAGGDTTVYKLRPDLSTPAD